MCKKPGVLYFISDLINESILSIKRFPLLPKIKPWWYFFPGCYFTVCKIIHIKLTQGYKVKLHHVFHQLPLPKEWKYMRSGLHTTHIFPSCQNRMTKDSLGILPQYLEKYHWLLYSSVMHNLHGIINSESRVGVQVHWVFSLVFLISTTHFLHSGQCSGHTEDLHSSECTCSSWPFYLRTGQTSFSLLP